MTYVLDASALLALLLNEPGADVVQDLLPGMTISAVNLSEVVAKLSDHGMPLQEAERLLAKLELRIEAFTARLAFDTAGLREATRPAGLSLGDRACLATARQLGARVVTADRAWTKVADAVGLEVERVR